MRVGPLVICVWRLTVRQWLGVTCGIALILSPPFTARATGNPRRGPSRTSIGASLLPARTTSRIRRIPRASNVHASQYLTTCTSSGEIISPCTVQATLAPGTQSHQVFWVQNNSIEDYVVSTGCTYTGAITSCSASPTSLSLTHGGGEKSFHGDVYDGHNRNERDGGCNGDWQWRP